MLSEPLLSWFNSELLASMAISDYSGAPLIARALAIAIVENGSIARIYANASCAPTFISQLGEGTQIAIAVEQPSTHRSVQLKGSVKAINALERDALIYCQAYRARFANSVEPYGFTQQMSHIFIPDPDHSAIAIDMAIAQVFEQSPGPDAGNRLGCEN
jgi:hypothetical protein